EGNRIKALEDDMHCECAGERTRHKHAAGRDEGGRFTESRAIDISVEVVAEVGAIGQVECLEDQLQFGALAELDVLADSHIQLEKGLAAQVVIRRLFASARRQASEQLGRSFAIVGQQVPRVRSVDYGVNGARATAETEKVADVH